MNCARQCILDAIDAGWSGPPFDPLQLADLLRLDLCPSADVDDAQTVPIGADRIRIEFNPDRPAGRVRFSVAHEIAHSLFPDCAEQVRHRRLHEATTDLDWQLEALCNIGAAEILMPYGSLLEVEDGDLTMESLLRLQKRFQVSTEALLIRVVRLRRCPVAMFCASRAAGTKRLRVDYMIRSPGWPTAPAVGLLPQDTALADCIRVGYTALADETWNPRFGKIHVEAVAIPPYPRSQYPRVVGIIQPYEREISSVDNGIRYIRGSALEPRGDGPKVIVQIVNDKTPNWGGRGFAQALRKTWPEVQTDFQDWAKSEPRSFRLGAVRFCVVSDELVVASIVAQRGYGPSPTPRIRYAALRAGLEMVREKARTSGSSLHMPRIGVGHAGGVWSVVSELIETICCYAGCSATVYDLPGADAPEAPAQQDLWRR